MFLDDSDFYPQAWLRLAQTSQAAVALSKRCCQSPWAWPRLASDFQWLLRLFQSILVYTHAWCVFLLIALFRVVPFWLWFCSSPALYCLQVIFPLKAGIRPSALLKWVTVLNVRERVLAPHLVASCNPELPCSPLFCDQRYTFLKLTLLGKTGKMGQGTWHSKMSSVTHKKEREGKR